MFCYKEAHLSHLRAHPEEQLAQWLDAHAAGLDAQLDLSIQLVRAGFRHPSSERRALPFMRWRWNS